jgi:hypothetical protein
MLTNLVNKLKNINQPNAQLTVGVWTLGFKLQDKGEQI